MQNVTKITCEKLPKEALSYAGMQQVELLQRLAIKAPALSGQMNRKNIRANNLISLLDAMGYSVMVGKKTPAGFEPIWEIEKEEP